MVVPFKHSLGEDIRRTSLSLDGLTLAMLVDIVKAAYGIEGRRQVFLKYLDEDKEPITLANETDMRELLLQLRSHAIPPPVRLFVGVGKPPTPQSLPKARGSTSTADDKSRDCPAGSVSRYLLAAGRPGSSNQREPVVQPLVAREPAVRDTSGVKEPAAGVPRVGTDASSSKPAAWTVGVPTPAPGKSTTVSTPAPAPARAAVPVLARAAVPAPAPAPAQATLPASLTSPAPVAAPAPPAVLAPALALSPSPAAPATAAAPAAARATAAAATARTTTTTTAAPSTTRGPVVVEPQVTAASAPVAVGSAPVAGSKSRGSHGARAAEGNHRGGLLFEEVRPAPCAPRAVHWGIICDGCESQPVVGVRYKSLDRFDFDLCEICRSTGRVPGLQNFEVISLGRPRNRRASGCRQVAHEGVRCDGCQESPLVGPRFKSLDRDDYDLCEPCKNLLEIRVPAYRREAFVRIDKPRPQPWQQAQTYVRSRLPADGNAPLTPGSDKDAIATPAAVERIASTSDKTSPTTLPPAAFSPAATATTTTPAPAVPVLPAVPLPAQSQPDAPRPPTPLPQLPSAPALLHATPVEPSAAPTSQPQLQQAQPLPQPQVQLQLPEASSPKVSSLKASSPKLPCGQQASLASAASPVRPASAGAPVVVGGAAAHGGGGTRHQVFRSIGPRRLIDACFVCDVNYPDGSQVPVGTPFTKAWRVRNAGVNPWPITACLLQVGGDDMAAVLPTAITTANATTMDGSASASIAADATGSPTDASNSRDGDKASAMVASNSHLSASGAAAAATKRDYSCVPPGAEVELRVPMRAPRVAGVYESYFKLAAGRGGPLFGHRVWCSIIAVEAPPAPAPAREAVEVSSADVLVVEVRAAAAGGDVTTDVAADASVSGGEGRVVGIVAAGVERGTTSGEKAMERPSPAADEDKGHGKSQGGDEVMEEAQVTEGQLVPAVSAPEVSAPAVVSSQGVPLPEVTPLAGVSDSAASKLAAMLGEALAAMLAAPSLPSVPSLPSAPSAPSVAVGLAEAEAQADAGLSAHARRVAALVADDEDEEVMASPVAATGVVGIPAERVQAAAAQAEAAAAGQEAGAEDEQEEEGADEGGKDADEEGRQKEEGGADTGAASSDSEYVDVGAEELSLDEQDQALGRPQPEPELESPQAQARTAGGEAEACEGMEGEEAAAAETRGQEREQAVVVEGLANGETFGEEVEAEEPATPAAADTVMEVEAAAGSDEGAGPVEVAAQLEAPRVAPLISSPSGGFEEVTAGGESSGNGAGEVPVEGKGGEYAWTELKQEEGKEQEERLEDREEEEEEIPRLVDTGSEDEEEEEEVPALVDSGSDHEDEDDEAPGLVGSRSEDGEDEEEVPRLVGSGLSESGAYQDVLRKFWRLRGEDEEMEEERKEEGREGEREEEGEEGREEQQEMLLSVVSSSYEQPGSPKELLGNEEILPAATEEGAEEGAHPQGVQAGGSSKGEQPSEVRPYASTGDHTPRSLGGRSPSFPPAASSPKGPQAGELSDQHVVPTWTAVDLGPSIVPAPASPVRGQRGYETDGSVSSTSDDWHLCEVPGEEEMRAGR
eukprot:jgi/Mesvir1/21859/Mv04239-RA.2